MPPDQLQQYIGVKTTVGKECELAYINQLMVMLWNSLATRSAKLLSYGYHHRAPRLLIDSSGVTYVRNHDDIGWAMADEDIAAVGNDPFRHRQFLNSFYTGDFAGSFARGALFQFNPVTKDARISGTTASLTGLEAALEERDEPGIDLAIRRILLLHSAIMFRGGIPLIYMGDEVGLLNDYSYLNDATKANDSRWIHRPSMDWAKADKRNDPTTIEGRIYEGLLHLIKIRTSTTLLHSFAFLCPMWTDNEHVWALARKRPEGTIMLLANFDENGQSVNADLLRQGGLVGNVSNLLAEGAAPNVAEGRVYLDSHQSMWLVGNG